MVPPARSPGHRRVKLNGDLACSAYYAPRVDFQRLTEDLMHALLNDIVGDADVSAALSQLPVQPTHKCVTCTIGTRALTSNCVCGRCRVRSS